jgi:hypothetical protein
MTTGTRRWLGLLAAVAVVGGMGAGCAWSIGGSKQGTTQVHPTKGQELIDLQTAKDKGAITPEEYDKQKARILGQ